MKSTFDFLIEMLFYKTFVQFIITLTIFYIKQIHTLSIDHHSRTKKLIIFLL